MPKWVSLKHTDCRNYLDIVIIDTTNYCNHALQV